MGLLTIDVSGKYPVCIASFYDPLMRFAPEIIRAYPINIGQVT